MFPSTRRLPAAYDGVTRRWTTMGKYALIGGDTSEAWGKMIENRGDSVARGPKSAQGVGAKLESFFWSFGEDDYLAIIDAPDDVTAGSVPVASGGAGGVAHTRA